MYHAIVKRIASKNFERVNQKDFDGLLRDCVPNIHHRFYGSHALSGERHDRDAVRRWFERLGRLAPGLTLTVQDVWVKGLPHDTTIILRWSARDTLIDGSPYRNYGVNVLRMRWFKIVDINAFEDSQTVAENLKLQAAHGVKEAAALPIIS
jgi:ketosteroid isomerase-like protein